MKIPHGYYDLRVELLNDEIINAYIEYGYSLIAVNTTVDCSLLGVGTSNRKKRKYSETNDETSEENEWVPAPKSIDKKYSRLTILNRLSIQILNMGHLQRIVNSKHFKSYDILAVEPLNDGIMQGLVSSPFVDIITCNSKTYIHPKEYKVAIDKKINFEVSYAPMLMDSTVRQETLTITHLLHLKGKSKNVIVTSGAKNNLDVRNPHDVMNIGILFGFTREQAKSSITRGCYTAVLKGYGRKLGKTAFCPSN